jgi:hypothetical protein
VGDVEGLVREPGQRSLGERDQPHGHVDPDDRHGGVDPVLDDGEVAPDVLALGDAVDDGRKTHREVGGDWLAVLVHVPPQWKRCPPSTLIVWPVMKLAEGAAR